MRIAVLGPGGVGGLIAAALHHAGTPVLTIARERSAARIEQQGIHLRSVRFGELRAMVSTATRLTERCDALIIATKAPALQDALRRIDAPPPLVLPLLNGVEHIGLLRSRFAPQTVAAGTIRVGAEHPEPGVVVHTSSFLAIEMAGPADIAEPMATLTQTLQDAGVPARVLGSEAQVMWSKLVRLNALACTTSAYDMPLGPIRRTPELRAELIGAIEEGCAVARAEGAAIDPTATLAELEQANPTHGSSMRRDIAAGELPEIDAIPGAVMRAGARHGIDCPVTARLLGAIMLRAGLTVQAPES